MIDLYKYAGEVVNWNWYAKEGKEEFSVSDFSLQGLLCAEEFNELLGSIVEDPQMKKEFVAEACDLFVAMSYYYYMKYGMIFDYDPKHEDIPDLISHIDFCVVAREYDLCIDSVYDLLYTLDAEEILKAKLASNWSKMPKLSEFCSTLGYEDLEELVKKEAERIEEASKGRYTGVTGNVVVGRDPRLIFRDSNGKVVKPCTYKGWENFLEKVE